MKRLLRSGAGFVDPNVQAGDLTGDGKADAVVKVRTGGAAGAIAVYLFSTHGADSDELRAVFRSQSLYRATTQVRGRDARAAHAALGAGRGVLLPREGHAALLHVGRREEDARAPRHPGDPGARRAGAGARARPARQDRAV